MATEDFNEIQKERASRWLVTYKILAWIHAVGMTLVTASGIVLILGGRRVVYIEPFRYMQYLPSLIILLVLAGCIGAILNRRWAPGWIVVTGIWLLSYIWYQILPIVPEVIRQFTYWVQNVIELNPSNRSMVLYVKLLVSFVRFLLMAIFIFSAYFVLSHGREAEETSEHKKLGTLRFLILGLIGVVGGYLLQWADSYFEMQIYLLTIGTYLVLSGLLLLLCWQVYNRRYLLPAAAVGVSVIAFLMPLYYNLLNYFVWILPAGLGIAGLILSRHFIKKALPASIVVFILMAISILSSSSYGIFPACPTFGVYYKEQSNRPEKFPQYLQVPQGASQVCYKGGPDASLSYEINDSFPAEKTISFISENLEKSGWKPLKYDLMNPQNKSSYVVGWNRSQSWLPYPPQSKNNADSEPDKSSVIHLPSSEWITDFYRDGESIRVYISYHPGKNPQNKQNISFYCNINLYSKNSSMSEFLNRYMKMHPEENGEVKK